MTSNCNRKKYAFLATLYEILLQSPEKVSQMCHTLKDEDVVKLYVLKNDNTKKNYLYKFHTKNLNSSKTLI